MHVKVKENIYNLFNCTLNGEINSESQCWTTFRDERLLLRFFTVLLTLNLNSYDVVGVENMSLTLSVFRFFARASADFDSSGVRSILITLLIGGV